MAECFRARPRRQVKITGHNYCVHNITKNNSDFALSSSSGRIRILLSECWEGLLDPPNPYILLFQYKPRRASYVHYRRKFTSRPIPETTRRQHWVAMRTLVVSCRRWNLRPEHNWRSQDSTLQDSKVSIGRMSTPDPQESQPERSEAFLAPRHQVFVRRIFRFPRPIR
jgi:hypothetical protein